jgi:hypothetical protein
MAKFKRMPRKIVGDDGPIKPSDPSNVAQNPSPPTPTFPDSQVAPGTSTVVRPVVQPPAPGSAQPSPPLVP